MLKHDPGHNEDMHDTRQNTGMCTYNTMSERYIETNRIHTMLSNKRIKKNYPN